MWRGGEGFEWYYADEAGRDAQDRLPITDGAYAEPWVFRYKDIRNWWSLPHHDRIGGVRQGSTTAWVPQSKPIWFTEIGCAAVDKGTNQPNKFIDPKSSESQLPWYSTGNRDDYIQMQYIRATCQFWQDPANNPVSSVYGASMVDVSRAHVWAWDARPYPEFPALTDTWSDGDNYQLGHWLNGRASSESLAAVVADICGRAGTTDIDVSELYGLVRGFGVDETDGARSALQPLSLAYGFDASEVEGRLRFRSRTGIPDISLAEDALTETGETVLSLQRAASGEAVGKVRVNYIQADATFETRSAEASLPDEDAAVASSTDLPICFTQNESRRIAERWLAEARIARDSASFSLPPSLSHIQAGDVVDLRYGDTRANFRVDRIEAGEALNVEAVRVEPDLFRPSTDVAEIIALPSPTVAVPVYSTFLDLPLITGSEDPVAPYLAAFSSPWPGSVAVYSAPEDDGYSLNSVFDRASVIGVTESVLVAAKPALPDLGASLVVKLSGGGLYSTTRTALLNGANALAIGDGAGDWEVLQFELAELVGTDTYRLSRLLRGQLGTDALMPGEWPVGSLVVLLDGAPAQIELASSARGLERHYRIGPSDRGYGDDSFAYVVHTASGVGLRPYQPVHLRVTEGEAGALWASWIRRTRIDGDSWEGLDVPLGEDRERYLVRVTQGESIVREAEVSEPEWHYTAAMRAEDALIGTAEIQVAQLSERYGAGPFQRIEIHD